MKRYIRTEDIMAKPMTVGEFYEQTKQSQFREMIEKGDGNEEGYFIEEKDSIPRWIPKNEFKKQYRVANTPLDRMVIEIYDLIDKSEKLYKFISGDKFMELDSETKALLKAQAYIMGDYKQLLGARADKMKEQSAEEKKERFLRFSFAVANAFLCGGFVVRRGSWDKGMVVIKQVPARISQDIIPNMQSLPTEAKNLVLKNTGFVYYQNQCLIYDTGMGVANSWSPSTDDIFACDWEVVTD